MNTLAASSNFVLTLHQGFANAALVYLLIMGGWGLILYFRGSNPSGGFVGALVIAGGLIAVQGLVGIGLLLQGHRTPEGLHYLYGVVAVLTLPTAYFSPYVSRGNERRDSLVLGLVALFCAGLVIRGITTG
jgi:hypothetical protein